MHRLVRTVGAEDGSAHMLLHLPLAQHTWSARSLLVSERLRRPVPLLVPPAHCLLSPRHAVARCECSEGMSAGVGSVLEEDAVLLLWRELLHGGVRCRKGTEVWQSDPELCTWKNGCAHVNRPC